MSPQAKHESSVVPPSFDSHSTSRFMVVVVVVGGGGSGSGSGGGGGEGEATADVADVERAASNIARLWQAEPVESAFGEAGELSPQQMATSKDVPCHEGESGCCVYTTAELEAVWPLVRVRGRVRGRANQV